MKFMIETGNESHTSSYAKMQAKVGGRYLYEMKQWLVSQEWDKAKHHSWCTAVYDVPAGTEIEIIGKSHGDDMHQIFRMEEGAEIYEDYLCRIQGENRGAFKGRMVLVRDVLAEKAQKLKASQEEGF